MDVAVRVEPAVIRPGERLTAVLENRGTEGLIYGPTTYVIERWTGDRWTWATFDLPALPEPEEGEAVAYGVAPIAASVAALGTAIAVVEQTAHLQPGRHRLTYEFAAEPRAEGPPAFVPVSAGFEVRPA